VGVHLTEKPRQGAVLIWARLAAVTVAIEQAVDTDT